jgi:hypothetical protein
MELDKLETQYTNDSQPTFKRIYKQKSWALTICRYETLMLDFKMNGKLKNNLY